MPGGVWVEAEKLTEKTSQTAKGSTWPGGGSRAQTPPGCPAEPGGGGALITRSPHTRHFCCDPPGCQAHMRPAARGVLYALDEATGHLVSWVILREPKGKRNCPGDTVLCFTDTSRLPLYVRIQPHNDSISALVCSKQTFHWTLGKFSEPSEGIFSVSQTEPLKRPALLLTSCVTQGKWLNLSDPRGYRSLSVTLVLLGSILLHCHFWGLFYFPFTFGGDESPSKGLTWEKLTKWSHFSVPCFAKRRSPRTLSLLWKNSLIWLFSCYWERLTGNRGRNSERGLLSTAKSSA